MLSLLLKLYPTRFRERMGDEWLMDTRQELQEARKAQSAMALVRWLARLLIGTAQGVVLAHRNEYELATEQGIEIVCGNQVVLLKKGGGSGSFWTVQRYAFLSGVGASIMGFVGFKLWLAGWVNGAMEQEMPQSKDSLMLMLYMAGMGVFVVAGAWIAWAHRVHRCSMKSQLINLAWIAIVAAGAWNIAFINWTLVDIGRTSTHMVEVFEDYPQTRLAMGLTDEEGNAMEWKAKAQDDPRCERALAVLDISKHKSLQAAKSNKDVIGLVLVDSLARDLWSRGCISKEERIAFNADLSEAAKLNKQEQRRLEWRGLGQFKEGHAAATKFLVLTHSKLCEELMVQQMALEGREADSQVIVQACAAVPNADQPVHSI